MNYSTVISQCLLLASTILPWLPLQSGPAKAGPAGAVPTPLDITITPTEVYETLSSLDPTKAMGPDGISPKVLKYSADILTKPIRYLFSLTLAKGYLPYEWHTHSIIPVFKPGNHDIMSSYCLISLLCIISKMIKKIIFKAITEFVSSSLIRHRFGFLSSRSTLQLCQWAFRCQNGQHDIWCCLP